eukprot:TRINITY_DN3782_c0_g1_i2.p1 TRINITY_DN3782_c0_g1~~TRINITY_DN3782_c0_g1_i2.p1  ORF type:complete len:193 (-),score=36.57 TRINITY_DN3782_c0_g1_i2:260-838(-)
MPSLVGSEMCIRDSINAEYMGSKLLVHFTQEQLGLTLSLFYFVENNQLVKYDFANNERMEFSVEHGLAGQVAKQQKGFIINDIKYSSYYNELVDIKSILPIYAMPIIEEDTQLSQKTILGVLEFTMKNSFKSIFDKDQLIDPTEGLISPDMNLASIVQVLAKNIALAIKMHSFVLESQKQEQQYQQLLQQKK